MWYIYTVDYYSAIKRNEIGSFVETWMDLETVIQSKSEREKQISYVYDTYVYDTYVYDTYVYDTCMWNLEKWYR